MKNIKTKYIKVRMTSEEVAQIKKNASDYLTVSNYVRAALDEYLNIGVKRQLELLRDLGAFYRSYQYELSHIGGNLNQAMKRANELSVAGLLTPTYIKEVLLPVIQDTRTVLNGLKSELDKLNRQATKL